MPDITVLRWERIPRDEDGSVANAVTVAPDWAIEILSPEQCQNRVAQKIITCLEGGSQMGWLIDPDDLSVLVFLPDRAPQFFDGAGTRLPVPDFATDLAVTVNDLQEYLRN